MTPGHGLDRFDWIGAESRALLLREGTLREYAPGVVLWTAGSSPAGLHFVLEGEVKIVRGGGNKQHVIHRAWAGDTIGEVPLFSRGRYPATAIAVARTACLLVSEGLLRRAMEGDPDLGWRFLEGLSERVRGLVDRVDERSAVHVRERILRLLLDRHERSRTGWFRLGATQAEVAEELGTVREVVVRVLREVREEGIIESDGRGRYRVRHPERLEAASSETG